MKYICLLTTILMVLFPVAVFAQDDGGESHIPPLLNSYSYQDGLLTFSYPIDWFVDTGDSTILLTNSETMLNSTTLASDMVGITFYSPEFSAIFIDPGMTLQEMMTATLRELLGESQPLNQAAPSEFMLDGYPAIRQDLLTLQGYHTILVVNLEQEHYLVLTITTLPGELDQFMDTVLAVIKTVRYAPSDMAAPTEGEVLPLTQHYQSDILALEFDYPENWQFQETASAAVVENQHPAIRDDGSYLPGAVQIAVYQVASYEQYGEVMGVDRDASPADILTVFIEKYAPLPEDSRLTDIETLTIGDNPAAQQKVRNSGGDGLYLLIKYPDDSIQVVAGGASLNGLSPYEPTLEAIAASIVVHEVVDFVPIEAPLNLSRTYESESLGLRFQYPDGWFVQETGQIIDLSNRRPLPRPDGLYQPGELELLIIGSEHYTVSRAQNAEGDLEGILANYSEGVSQRTPMLLSDIESLDIGGRQAVLRYFEGDDDEGVFILIADGQDLILISAAALSGELEAIEFAPLAIAETIQLIPDN